MGKKTTKDKGGAPTKFKEEYSEQARKLCLLGATDKEMAEFFGVSEKTLNNWKAKHPEFLQSITRGKIIADAEVAEKLRHRALGYSHDDVHVSNYLGNVTLTPLVKHYPPDTNAAAIWLYNRQPGKWRRAPAEDSDDNIPVPVKIEVQVVDARKDADTE